jgi:transcription elongation factor Elf1
MARKYTIERIDYLDPKRKFECARCDREGMVSPHGAYRRFRVHMKTPAGRTQVYCVVCASILTGRRQGELMREGRERAGVLKKRT